MGLDEIKEKAKEALETVKEKAEDLGDKAKDVIEDVKDKASDIVGDVKDRFDGDDESSDEAAVAEPTGSGDTIVDVSDSAAAPVTESPVPGEPAADGVLDATEDSAASGSADPLADGTVEGIVEPVNDAGVDERLGTSQDAGEPLDPSEGTPLDAPDGPEEFKSTY